MTISRPQVIISKRLTGVLPGLRMWVVGDDEDSNSPVVVSKRCLVACPLEIWCKYLKSRARFKFRGFAFGSSKR